MAAGYSLTSSPLSRLLPLYDSSEVPRASSPLTPPSPVPPLASPPWPLVLRIFRHSRWGVGSYGGGYWLPFAPSPPVCVWFCVRTGVSPAAVYQLISPPTGGGWVGVKVCGGKSFHTLTKDIFKVQKTRNALCQGFLKCLLRARVTFREGGVFCCWSDVSLAFKQWTLSRSCGELTSYWLARSFWQHCLG